MEDAIRILKTEVSRNNFMYSIEIERVVKPFLYYFGLKKKYLNFKPLYLPFYINSGNSKNSIKIKTYTYKESFQCEEFINLFLSITEKGDFSIGKYKFIAVGVDYNGALKKSFYLKGNSNRREKYNHRDRTFSSKEKCIEYIKDETHVVKSSVVNLK
jgi:hypothetical protein